MKTKIFIDTDMGNDDIMAISMLLLSKQFTITGISTVNGVSNPKKGFMNIKRLLKYINVNIPIAQGSQKALYERKASFPVYDKRRAEYLTLLQNLNIPQISTRRSKSLVDIEDFIYLNSQKTIVVALGPLTNIAKTIAKYGDDFINNINELLIMGGGIELGNVPPSRQAEFNIWLDPEAARIVFSSKIPITLIGIDACQFVPNSKNLMDVVATLNPYSKEGKIIKEIVLNSCNIKGNDFDYFYDPLTVSVLLDKKIITKFSCTSINVKLTGRNRGITAPFNSSANNVCVAMKVNPQRFYKLLIDLIND